MKPSPLEMDLTRQATPLTYTHRPVWIVSALAVLLLSLPIMGASDTIDAGQGERTQRSLTPLQAEIEKQRQRLNSAEVEERRDAVMRLGALRHPDASRAALSALKDASPIIRATASAAVLGLPAHESAAALLPLLNDKNEFVRQEAAYALGNTRSKTAVPALMEKLTREQKHGVRGAVVVALGRIADESAVVTLARVLSPRSGLGGSKKNQSNRKENVLVLRAAAHSLGQIASRAGLPALLATLEDEKIDDDVRREAARALGLIGDPSAIPALRKVLAAPDPYLSIAANEALRRISRQQTARPG